MNQLYFVCYRDVYLLDNPLSMVDADTAAAVFDKCILKALRGRTVIMATHQVQVGATFQAEGFTSFVIVVKLICSNFCTLDYCMKVVIRVFFFIEDILMC